MAKNTYDKIVEYIIENQQKFYRIAYCYVYNKDSALDIVQNAICKALEHYHSLRNPDAVKTWFYRILVNESLTYIKKNGKEIAYEPTELKEEIYYEAKFEPGFAIYDEINKLSKEMKTVVVLHFFEQLTLKEVSEVTGVNLNTVKSRLYAALSKLKEGLKEEYYDGQSGKASTAG